MRLIDYLRTRHPTINALTAAEAKLLGLRYPLVKGWVTKFADRELSDELVSQLNEAREKRYASENYQAMREKMQKKAQKRSAQAQYTEDDEKKVRWDALQMEHAKNMRHMKNI